MGLARVRETTFSAEPRRDTPSTPPLPAHALSQGLPTSGVRLSRPVMTLVLCFLPSLLPGQTCPQLWLVSWSPSHLPSP